MKKLRAKQLRQQSPPKGEPLPYSTPMTFVLDGIEDTYNIGSFFRLADALGIGKIYLCGQVVTPPNIKIHRASVGLCRWVEWEHHRRPEELLRQLKKEGYLVVAVEQGKKSLDWRDFKPRFPLALVVGHEGRGVSSGALKEVEAMVELPLLGVNHSLNVLVAAAVVGYYSLAAWLEKTDKKKQ